jgi:hypothetical protein
MRQACPKNRQRKMVSEPKKLTKTALTDPLLCPWPGCGRHLSRIDHLRRHVAGHTDAKSFKCPAPFCGYAAKRKDNLKDHLQLRHKLGAAAARRGANKAAQDALAETRSLGVAVKATIDTAKRIGDAESDQNASAGRKRKNGGRSGDEASRKKHNTRSSGSTDTKAAETGQAAAVDGADQDEDEYQTVRLHSGQDRSDDVAPDDDGPGATPKAAYGMRDSGSDLRAMLDFSSEEEDEP